MLRSAGSWTGMLTLATVPPPGGHSRRMTPPNFSTKRAEQMLVLDYLISKVAPGRNYSERELTALIGEWLSPNVRQGAAAATFAIDAVTLRRALVEESQLQRTRDGRSYWRDEGK